MGGGAVVLLAVGRAEDRASIATFFGRISSKDQNQSAVAWTNALKAVKLNGNTREMFSSEDSVTHVLVDADAKFVYAAVIKDKTYAERVAYKMLEEFESSVVAAGPLKLQSFLGLAVQRTLRGRARALMLKYEDPADTDVTIRVIKKVEDVKIIMEANVMKVLENQGKLESLEEKTGNLAATAKKFNETTTQVQAVTWKQKMWLTIGLAFVGLILFAYILYIVISTFI